MLRTKESKLDLDIKDITRMLISKAKIAKAAVSVSFVLIFTKPNHMLIQSLDTAKLLSHVPVR